MKERQKKSIVTVEEVLQGLKSIAEKVDAKDSDKIKAWELLGKHLAMFDRPKESLDEYESDGFVDSLEKTASEVWEQ